MSRRKKGNPDTKPVPASRTGLSLLLSAFVLGALVGAGSLYLAAAPGQDPDMEELRADQLHIGSTPVEKYPYINPIIECERVNQPAFIRPFSRKISNALSMYASAGAITNSAVYFRMLNDGHSFNIRATEDFTPASLMKLPLMMAYFKMAEKEPSVLSKKIKFVSDMGTVVTQTIRPSLELEKGKSYSVRELIERMIIYSDNSAFWLLSLNDKDNEMFRRTFNDLGLLTPGLDIRREELNVREYTSFFRILYNATYLNREHSNMALDILSRSDYTGGLVAGVPEGIKVAHKFGERSSDSSLQLHDCGIVYHPGTPYLVCVMTRGTDFGRMTEVISGVSRLIYEEVSAQTQSVGSN